MEKYLNIETIAFVVIKKPDIYRIPITLSVEGLDCPRIEYGTTKLINKITGRDIYKKKSVFRLEKRHWWEKWVVDSPRLEIPQSGLFQKCGEKSSWLEYFDSDGGKHEDYVKEGIESYPSLEKLGYPKSLSGIHYFWDGKSGILKLWGSISLMRADGKQLREINFDSDKSYIEEIEKLKEVLDPSKFLNYKLEPHTLKEYFNL